MHWIDLMCDYMDDNDSIVMCVELIWCVTIWMIMTALWCGLNWSDVRTTMYCWCTKGRRAAWCMTLTLNYHFRVGLTCTSLMQLGMMQLWNQTSGGKFATPPPLFFSFLFSFFLWMGGWGDNLLSCSPSCCLFLLLYVCGGVWLTVSWPSCLYDLFHVEQEIPPDLN